MSDIGHNAEAQIRAIADRYQRLNEEKAAINEDIKVLMAEARASGFDTKVLKYVLRKMQEDAAALVEFNAVADLYFTALGRPFVFAADRRTTDAKGEPEKQKEPEKPNDFYARAHVPAPAREEAAEISVEQAVQHDPETGEIFEQPAVSPPEVVEGQPEPSSPAGESDATASLPPVNAVAGNIHLAAQGEQESADVGFAQPPAPPSPPREETLRESVLRMRPYCQRPGEDECGGYGTNHCSTCLKAKIKADQAAQTTHDDDFETPAFLRRGEVE